uniref:Uncharacterized protein n=1 Tax=Anguilla anguilla TaxID=7936 RepID=A0A0E9UD90_ANGAN
MEHDCSFKGMMGKIKLVLCLVESIHKSAFRNGR